MADPKPPSMSRSNTTLQLIDPAPLPAPGQPGERQTAPMKGATGALAAANPSAHMRARDSVFGRMLENNRGSESGLYVASKMEIENEAAAGKKTDALSETFRALYRCLSPGEAERQLQEELAEKQRQRRRWGQDIRAFFVNHGEQMELAPGEVFAGGGDNRNECLDCIYFIIQGEVVER